VFFSTPVLRIVAASDCIPVEKIGDFFRCMGCNPSAAETAEATQMADPHGEGIARFF